MGIFSNNPDYYRRGSYAGPSVSAFSLTEIHELNRQQNEAIKKWVPKVRRNLKNNARKFVNGKTESFVKRPGRTEQKLANSIRSKTKKQYGSIEVVTFQFERHGVFVHKGVSRGHPISNPRQKTEWFNPPLERYLPELADKLADINTNIAVNATRMKIN